ncbi:GNAT family N-acetyltransferase [Algoriphagus hitonicola]|uniref:Acetyltransferase (GNAT) family protein n=1 Tax=Algoriphagus hitonicola TaxID=435880 RepID=A0A1I2PBZ6_9BACT|nr:GNAT family N-acetyltransferase [Algoriphagus hitonicola]SFG11186.1 Acetyltransferase (GNAT) family protein [Algoriphagus hitonicola]
MLAAKILPFSAELQPHFESINREWVEALFAIEPFDLAQLKNPQETIIDPGGLIIFAQLGEEIVGTVGLAKVDEETFELIKMGVKKSAQGKGIGLILGQAILEKAKEMGAKKVELYTHTKLASALKIYRKLGFREEVPEPGKYCRCDLKMVLTF